MLRQERPASAFDAFKIDENSPEMKALAFRATEGSPEAAMQLVTRYSHCHKSNPTAPKLETCKKAIGYWTEIALENGSTTAVKYRIDDLLGSKKCLDVARAEFWYNRLSRSKYDSTYMKSVGEEILEVRRSCSGGTF